MPLPIASPAADAEDSGEEWLNELLTSFRSRTIFSDGLRSLPSTTRAAKDLVAVVAPRESLARVDQRHSLKKVCVVRSSGAPYPTCTGPAGPQKANPVKMMLSTNVASGKILAHATATIGRLLLDRRLCIWKIGVTQDPEYRFSNESFGYALEDYSGMVVVHKGQALECGMLEAALIMILKSAHPGCQNIASGGEGMSRKPDLLFYTYCAYKHVPMPT